MQGVPSQSGVKRKYIVHQETPLCHFLFLDGKVPSNSAKTTTRIESMVVSLTAASVYNSGFSLISHLNLCPAHLYVKKADLSWDSWKIKTD